jgi:AcrR family transcriptional regulator
VTVATPEGTGSPAGPAGPAGAAGEDRADRAARRRSALSQTRSRNTRRKLIRTALELWNERGFESAFDEITAEDIARAAGVSKGTFYFHFARKDDILLEMPWATAEIMISEAQAAMERGDRTSDIVNRLLTSLARRVARAPRGAMLRVVGQWSIAAGEGPPGQPRGIGEAFAAVGAYAIERGDLPRDVEVDEFASLLQSATMDALINWSASDESPAELKRRLCRRADVIICGVAVSYRR